MFPTIMNQNTRKTRNREVASDPLGVGGSLMRHAHLHAEMYTGLASVDGARTLFLFNFGSQLFSVVLF